MRAVKFNGDGSGIAQLTTGNLVLPCRSHLAVGRLELRPRSNTDPRREPVGAGPYDRCETGTNFCTLRVSRPSYCFKADSHTKAKSKSKSGARATVGM